MLDMLNRGHTNPQGVNTQKPLKWIIVDSVIVALIAMVAVMPERAPTGDELYSTLWVMLKAFLAALLAQIVIERGIKRQ